MLTFWLVILTIILYGAAVVDAMMGHFGSAAISFVLCLLGVGTVVVRLIQMRRR